MSVVQALPKTEPWCLQKCPICGCDNYMVVRGEIDFGEGRREVFPDMGYSFCNCHNIFYTTWCNYDNPVEELRKAFDRLEPANEYQVTIPDPFFINWDNPHEFLHWQLRKPSSMVIWDIDSLCAVIEEIGFIVVGRFREFGVDSKVPMTTTLIFGKEELTARASVKAAIDWFRSSPIEAVEVGTHTGRHAEMILKHWPAVQKLYLVDLWKAYEDFPVQEWQDQDFEICRHKFLHNEKVDIRREDSAEAAKKFSDHSLDFVYIDAAHDYDSVKRDILAWLPKVRHGGILAGHDYLYYGTPDVKRAVDEIFGSSVHSGKNYNNIHDWWVYL